MIKLNESKNFQQNYWLNINKPEGYSSAKIVAIVKKITKAKKVGHAGTLDPFASGVLPIALNKATKTSGYIADAIKKYYFEIVWGKFTDSDDITGNVTEISDCRPKTENIIDILPKFIGKINQVPSQFSAIKINGERSYKLARQGLKFEMRAREVRVFSIKLIFNDKVKAGFEVFCGKGTYIRSLAKDLASQLKVCGYVSILRRMQVGDFVIKNTISLAKLKNMVDYPRPNNILLPLREVLNFIPEIELESFDASKIKNGQFVNLSYTPFSYKINNKDWQSSTAILVVKVINEGVLISLASLEKGLLKPLNNF